MRLTYKGPYDEVEVPSLGLVFRRNEPVEVPDAGAKALLEQPDNFKKSVKKETTP